MYSCWEPFRQTITQNGSVVDVPLLGTVQADNHAEHPDAERNEEREHGQQDSHFIDAGKVGLSSMLVVPVMCFVQETHLDPSDVAVKGSDGHEVSEGNFQFSDLSDVTDGSLLGSNGGQGKQEKQHLAGPRDRHCASSSHRDVLRVADVPRRVYLDDDDDIYGDDVNEFVAALLLQFGSSKVYSLQKRADSGKLLVFSFSNLC